eukprot:861308_1
MAAAICDSEHSCSELEVAENLPEIWYFQNGLRIAHTSPDCSNDIQRFILTETTRALHGKLSEVKRGRTLHIKGSFKVRKNTELCGGKARAITWTMNITSSKTDTVSKRVPVVQIFDEKNDLQQFHNDNAESMVLYYYPDCKTDDLIMFAIVSKEIGIEVAKVDCKKSQSACYSEEAFVSSVQFASNDHVFFYTESITREGLLEFVRESRERASESFQGSENTATEVTDEEGDQSNFDSNFISPNEEEDNYTEVASCEDCEEVGLGKESRQNVTDSSEGSENKSGDTSEDTDVIEEDLEGDQSNFDSNFNPPDEKEENSEDCEEENGLGKEADQNTTDSSEGPENNSGDTSEDTDVIEEDLEGEQSNFGSNFDSPDEKEENAEDVEIEKSPTTQTTTSPPTDDVNKEDDFVYRGDYSGESASPEVPCEDVTMNGVIMICSDDKFQVSMGDENSMVLFCHDECTGAFDTFSEVAEDNMDESDVRFGKVDCRSASVSSLCDTYGTSSEPTIVFFGNDQLPVTFNEEMTRENVDGFLDENTGTPGDDSVDTSDNLDEDAFKDLLNGANTTAEVGDEECSYEDYQVTVLTNVGEFQNFIGSEHDSVVLFCWVYCTSEFEALVETARQFTESNISFGKVNCDDSNSATSICNTNDADITGVQFFRNGEKVATFAGTVNTENLKEFCSSNQQPNEPDTPSIE